MIRPINRSLPFDFGPLLGPLAEPSGNPPPPDDPFGGRDLFAPEDPNKKHPFDGPIKPKPNPFMDYPWPDEDIRVQDPKDKVLPTLVGIVPCTKVKIYYKNSISQEWFGVYMTQTPGEYQPHLQVRAYMRGVDLPNYSTDDRGYFTDYEGDVGYIEDQRDLDWPILVREWDFEGKGETLAGNIIGQHRLLGNSLSWDHISISFVQNESYDIPIDGRWHLFRRVPPVMVVINGIRYEIALEVMAYLDENGCLVIIIGDKVIGLG